MFRTQIFIKSMCILIISLTLQDQWWCCGFNPAYIGKVDVHKQILVGKVDMSRFVDDTGNCYMYEYFKKEMQQNKDNNKLLPYLYFDDITKTFWIMWGDNL